MARRLVLRWHPAPGFSSSLGRYPALVAHSRCADRCDASCLSGLSTADQISDIALSSAVGRPSLIWVIVAVISPVVVLGRVLSHRHATIETLWGAMSVYLLMAIAFNHVFLEVQRFGSIPFFGADESTSSFMYFSVVTITTLGYGDLASASDITRYFATSEAIIGQVFPVTIVARLVSLLSRPPAPSDA
jgi:hypothetical protein